MSSNMPCKNFFSVTDRKIQKSCKFGDKCNFSHKDEDCAKFLCPMNVVDKVNKDGVCNNTTCPYMHTGEIRKTFNHFGCEVKAAGILMYKRTKEGLEFMLIYEPDKGYFSDAGGKLNINDSTPFNGAKREFKEETGCEFNQQITSQIYIPQAKYLLFCSEVASTYEMENENCRFMTFGIFRSTPRLEELPPINPRLKGCMPGFPAS